MKKLLAIALIAASFTACNDSAKTEEKTTGTDTSTVVVPAATAPDSLKTTVTDTTVKTTTTTKAVDTAKKAK